MSIRFNIAKIFVQFTGMKKMSSLSQEELIRTAQKLNRNRVFKIPKRKGFHYIDKTILDCYHCLKIETQESKSKRALLFLFGGGHILGPDNGDVKLAEKMGKCSGRDVWFPYYPLCIDKNVKESHEMVYVTYKEMLKEYKPEDIAVLGFSSGGALAIGMCLYNNEQTSPLPMPGLLIASSPGSVPVSTEEMQKMEELSPKDILINAAFMNTMKAVMEHGTVIPDYMVSGISGNFKNFPMTHFYYGSNEVLYAEAPYFARAYEKYKAPCQMHIGKGMCHCYPALTFCPEGKQAQIEIINLLSD